jgi:hypothetical protein
VYDTSNPFRGGQRLDRKDQHDQAPPLTGSSSLKHVFFSSLRKAPRALQSLIHQRCSNENEWQ